MICPNVSITGFLGSEECENVHIDETQGLDELEEKEVYSITSSRKRLEVTVTRELNKKLDAKATQERLALGNVTPGEVLAFDITIIKRSYHFSEIYSRNVIATWQTRRCPYLSYGIGCVDIEEKIGRCKALYRDFKDISEIPLALNDREQWPFSVTIGGSEQALDRHYFFSKFSLATSLTVTQDMIEQGDDLAIEIIQPVASNTRIGFIEYDKDCKGLGQRNFKTSANESFLTMQNSDSYHLELKMKRSNKHEE